MQPLETVIQQLNVQLSENLPQLHPLQSFYKRQIKKPKVPKQTKLELLDTIRRTARAAIDTLDDSEEEEAHSYAEEMLVTVTKIFNQQLPNF